MLGETRFKNWKKQLKGSSLGGTSEFLIFARIAPGRLDLARDPVNTLVKNATGPRYAHVTDLIHTHTSQKHLIKAIIAQISVEDGAKARRDRGKKL